MIEKKWFVYLIRCMDGSFYTGVTNDLEKRMNNHKSGKGSKYVASRGFGELLAWKECLSKSEACKHEYFIKQLNRNDKIEWFRSGL